MIINDAFRVWAENDETFHEETLTELQAFIRDYLLQVQQDLCARIKQDFSITVFASGVIDGGKH